MTGAAEKYEDEVLQLQPQKGPASIPGAVELKMFGNRMSQAKLADALGVAKSKLTEILNGKRKPGVPFLKALYKVLKTDAGFLPEHACPPAAACPAGGHLAFIPETGLAE